MAGVAPDGAAAAREGSAGRPAWRILILLAFMVALAWFTWDQREALEPVFDAPLRDVALIGALVVGGHFLNASEFWILYRATGARPTLAENWMLFTAGQLANHLPGQPGTLYRFRYMRVVHGTPYTHSAAVYGANLAITLAGAAIVGVVGVLGAAVATGTRPSLALLFVFGAMVAVALAVAVVPLPLMSHRRGRLARAWRSFHGGFEEIRRDPRASMSVLGLEAAKYVVTAWRIQVAFVLLGVREPFWFFLVLAPVAGVASFLSITPAALGFREAFLAAAAVAMGAPIETGLLGATVDRTVMVLSAIVLGSVGLAITYRRLRTRETPTGM